MIAITSAKFYAPFANVTGKSLMERNGDDGNERRNNMAAASMIDYR